MRWTIDHNNSFETLRERNLEELLSTDKMRVLCNVWFFVLVIVTTEDVWQTSSIVVEKAIKSLVKTMGNTFDKLIAVVNVTSQGKPTVKPGKFSVNKLSERLARTTRFESQAQSGMKERDRAYRREGLFFRVESLALTVLFAFLSVVVC